MRVVCFGYWANSLEEYISFSIMYAETFLVKSFSVDSFFSIRIRASVLDAGWLTLMKRLLKPFLAIGFPFRGKTMNVINSANRDGLYHV